MRILGFEPYVAPDNFDRKAQPVDIYDVFERYYRHHRDAKYIFSVADSFTPKAGLTGNEMPLMQGNSFVYGYELSGVKYRVNLKSTTRTITGNLVGNYTSIPVTSTEGFPDTGKITVGGSLGTMYGWGGQVYFTYTSKDATNFYGDSQYINTNGNTSTTVFPVINWTGTNRWVIVENPTTSKITASVKWIIGPVWLYCGNLVNIVATADVSTHPSSIKYIHVNKLDDIEAMPYASHWLNSSLTGTLHIPTTLTAIGSYNGVGDYLGLVFSGCTGLTGVLNIPDSVIRIGNAAFNGTKFTSVNFGSGVIRIDGSVFANCSELNGTLTIPGNIISIGNQAFQNCTKLDSIDLKEGVQTIGSSTFQGCTQLTGTLTFPNSVTLIDQYAFESVPKITAVYSYPSTAPTIGTNGLTLGGTARPLHIPTGGGTGYGVTPWTTATIFTQPAIADL